MAIGPDKDATTLTSEAVEYLCGLIKATVFSPSSIIDDNNLATNTTYSSFKLDQILATLDPKWDNIQNKPFDNVSSDFVIDANNDLALASTVFDNVTNQLNLITAELSRKPSINDANVSTNETWSSQMIKDELDKKSSGGASHIHNNIDTVLNKLDTSNNDLLFDSKTVLMKEDYDVDNDGVIDKAKSASTLENLLATITELNYLQGVQSNIQSQINAISTGVQFKGEYQTYANMLAALPTPEQGYWVYIVNDENMNESNTQYVHDGTSWVYGGGRAVVNDATNTSKGIITLSGDLDGTANAPQLATITTAQTLGYIKGISVDAKGRVTSITEDTTLLQRISDLENRPQIYVSTTQPATLKDGDIWIVKP